MGGGDPPAMLRRLLVTALLGLLAAASHAAPQVTDDSFSIERVVEGLAVPTTMAFIGAGDFLVLEKDTGRVRRATGGVLNPTAVLDLAVSGCGERGLLGIAVHPQFGAGMDKDWVYLYYTSSDESFDVSDCGSFVPGIENRLDRFEWNGSALVNQTPLGSFPSFFSYHNGGPLAFGPDGKLYGVNGDGDQDAAAQNNEFLNLFDDTGVIFRLNDDGSTPTDNPFYTDDMVDDSEDRYFAYGIRNSFGLAFDPESESGELWDTENGANVFDEINRVVAGANSGWRDIMGPGPEPSGLFELPGSTYIQPAYSIQVPVAPTGLAFASSNTSFGASNQGNLYVADYELGNIYEFELNDARTGLDLADLLADNQSELNAFRFATGFTGGLSDLKEGPDGDLYAVAIALGEVWRISGGEGGGPPPHDLAVSQVKAPKKVSLSESKPVVVKDVKLTIVNQGSNTETIDDQDELTNLITLTWTSLGACSPPFTQLVPPKKGFPVVLATKKKLSVSYGVTWNCANDPAQSGKDADHADFELEVTLDHAAVDGESDSDPGDDVCPRPASGDDKGCGGKDANGASGGPIRTDVVVK